MVNGSGSEAIRRSVRRLIFLVLFALAGLLVAAVVQDTTGIRLRDVANSAAYGKIITSLLAVGLFASVYGISRRELRRNAVLVLAAVTLGVAGKAFLVGWVMVLAFGGAGNLLLGVAIAQIDPLSVAAGIHGSGMSRRAKSLLLAWASFDDPVTVLLVAYLANSTFPDIRQHSPASLLVMAGGSYLHQAELNVGLITVAALLWYLLAVRLHDRGTRGTLILQCLTLTGLIAVAVALGLLAGLAVCGLFFRPRIGPALDRIAGLAFYGATFILGSLLLVAGVDLTAGVLLGVTVFAVQMVCGAVIGRGLPRSDRLHLALGQQNGLTAITLALALQPYIHRSVGILAVAILAVNVTHILTHGIWVFAHDHLQQREGKSLLLANHGERQSAALPTRQ